MEILKPTLNLKKRDCKTKMRLIPYGGGWTDVYVSFEGSEELYFIISDYYIENFQTLLRALYFLYPANGDNENAEDLMEYKYGYSENDDEVITKVVDIEDLPGMCEYCQIPWKTQFTWSDDRNSVTWYIERIPDTSKDFDITIRIDVSSDESKQYEYTVPYKDMCYAVADACTKAIKKHGFRGYHAATYFDDINIRYLLLIKSIALENLDACKMQYPEPIDEGPRSDLMKELELLLFDMS